MLYLDDNIYYRNNRDKGYSSPRINGQELIFTQNKELQKSLRPADVRILSEYVGLNYDMGLYELFSFFFEGKIQEDFDMVEALFNGFLIDSDWCFCLKIGVTFCWFTIQPKKLQVLGTMQYSESISCYTVGKFMKRLRYKIVKSGVNLSKLKFLVWSEEDVQGFWGSYFLQYDCLSTFFSRIHGLKGFDAESVMKILSKKLHLRYHVTAENFVSCLNDSFLALKLEQKDGVLYSRSTYLKDYSTCSCPIIEPSRCSYGVVIDCEGKKNSSGSLQDGFSELGGLIYCKYDNILVSLDSFVCNENLFEATIEQMVRNYNDLTGRFRGTINLLCFGSSDEVMLGSSLQKCSKKFRKTFRNTFKFVDCRHFIASHISEPLDNNSLTSIATAFGVKPIYPKHNPMNDARTLFNILAQILTTTDLFVC